MLEYGWLGWLVGWLGWGGEDTSCDVSGTEIADGGDTGLLQTQKRGVRESSSNEASPTPTPTPQVNNPWSTLGQQMGCSHGESV